MKRFRYDGYINYPGIGKIRDSDVYDLIKNHSRMIDRLSGSKMVEMSLIGQCVLMGIFDNITPDGKWKFYGRHAPKAFK